MIQFLITKKARENYPALPESCPVLRYVNVKAVLLYGMIQFDIFEQDIYAVAE